jgi:hypothetical protein
MTAVAGRRTAPDHGRAAARNAAGVAAIVTLCVAVAVIVFGVLVTSGVYGSRLAWLFGVALPLLAVTMLLSWLSVPLSARATLRTRAVVRSRREQIARAVFLTALSLFGLPLALALMLLAVIAVVGVIHELSLLV